MAARKSNREPQESNPTPSDVVLAIVFFAGSGWGFIQSIVSRAYGLAAITGGFCLAMGAYIIYMLRRGVRKGSAFEQFEQRQLFRLLLIIALGILAMIANTLIVQRVGDGLEPLPLVIRLVLLAIWLIALAVSAWRIRGRMESRSSYQRRVKYKEINQVDN